MKKVLSFILVLSMVLSSFGMAFAAPAKDEVAGHLNEDATLRLADLGIVQGDDRGFALDANITRAEFAVLLVRALGLEGSANVAKGETQFTDVTVAAGYEWASGAINVATRLGYIQGYGNGKFGPADSIRYEDAITLVVRALGYEPAAQAKGGYPVGYLVVAEQDVKNTKHVEGAQGVAIKRGPVFQLLDNSLTKAKMVQVGFGTDAKYVVSGTGKGSDYVSKQTILTTNLGFDEVEGTVVANYRVDKLKADEIKIAVEKINGDDADKTTKYSISDKADADVDAILGLKVSAWYNDDKDELFRYEVITDEDDVVYGTVLTNKEDKNTLKVEVRDGKDSTKKYAWAEKDSKNGITEAVAYVKNDEVDVEKVEEGSYGRFVLNEYGDVTFAYLFKFDEVGIAVETTKDEIEFINAADADEDVIELDDYKAEDVFVFNTDFSKASLEDIEAGTAIFSWENDDDELFIIVRNDNVEGKLEAVRVKSDSNDRVTVAGKNINVAGNAIFSDDKADSYKLWSQDYTEVEDIVDEEVTVILDLAGRVLALTTDVNVKSSTIYGIATYITTGRNPVVTVFTNEGKEVDYKFANREDANDLLNKINTSNASYGKDFAAISFKLNKDGEIVKGSIEDLLVKADEKTLVKADEKHKYVQFDGSNYYIRENTVLVKAFNNKNELKPALVKYENIIDKKIDATNAIVIGTASKDAKLIVFTDGNFQAIDDVKVGLVVSDVTARGGKYYVDVNVTGEGKAEYIVPARGTVTKGQIINFRLNDKGEISLDGTPINVKTATQSTFKVVTEKDGNYLKFDTNTKFNLVGKDTPIFELTKTGNLDTEVRLSKVSVGDKVFVKLDDSGEIEVLLLASKYYDEKFGTLPPVTGTEGVVTYINGTGTAFAVDGVIYSTDAKTVVKNAAGAVIGLGDASILVVGDVVDVKDNVITRKVSVVAEAAAFDALFAGFTGTQAQVTAARTAYDKLNTYGKALVTPANVTTLVTAEDTLAAAAVDALIDAITATPTQAQVTAARTAYDALSAAGKLLVADYADLQAAEAKLVAAVVDTKLAALPAAAAVKLADKDQIEAARAAYNTLTVAQEAQLTPANVTKLNNAEAAIVDLEAAVVDVNTAKTALTVASIFDGVDSIELPADTATVTYTIAIGTLPTLTTGSVTGTGVNGSPAVIVKDAEAFTFDVTVTITAVQDAGTAVDETTISTTVEFTVTVPNTVAPITVAK